MAKRGPKLIQINWVEFDKLCYMQCTLNEIAAWFECSPDTIENRCKQIHGIKFSDYYAKKKAKGKIALRRAQFQNAVEKNNTTMQIWLGKQYLDQSEKVEAVTENKLLVENKNYKDLPKEKLLELYNQKMKG